jgi:GTP:adenosylcobinamide-phosphate guanylyltransferase
MARAYGVSHKCILPVEGVPMLRRVVEALRASKSVRAISICIENPAIAAVALSEKISDVTIIQSRKSAPLSAIAAVTQLSTYPFLITTADHALLTPEMVEYFCNESTASGADFSAGLARAEVILAAYPQSVRTFFRLGPDSVSGCNLFAVQNAKGLRILERWKYLETVRKRPWRLVAAFGPLALLRFVTGRLSLQTAFQTISSRLGMEIKPVLMPFAEAAIDVDKPSDLELAESILKNRSNTTNQLQAALPAADPRENQPRTI